MSAADGTFTTWWANRYTRGLPHEVRERRCDEIASDVFEELHAASNGRRPSVTWRTLRGIPSDVAWRRQELRAMRANSPAPPESPLRNVWAVVTQRWFAPLAVLLLVFDVLFAIAVFKDEKSKMPGQAVGPVLLVLCAAAIGTGLWLRWRATPVITSGLPAVGASRRAVGNRTIAGLLAVLGVTLALLVIGGSAGSAAIFFVALAFVGVSALIFGGRAVVHALRSSDPADKAGLADGLVIVGTFPALAMFWMIVPPMVAVIVIGGVLGTSPKFRPAA